MSGCENDYSMTEYRLDYEFDDLEISSNGISIFFGGRAIMAVDCECVKYISRIDDLQLDTYFANGGPLIDIEHEGLTAKVESARKMIERIALAEFQSRYDDGLIPDSNR